ncbi:unnamed protein product [Cochlearia groenlandica]
MIWNDPKLVQKKDAWEEELNALFDSKPWISDELFIAVFLLNQATNIINLWQSSGVNICLGWISHSTEAAA